MKKFSITSAFGYHVVRHIIFQEFVEYCKMVDLARKFKIDQSIALQWSPEEFQQVLSMYTDQVKLPAAPFSRMLSAPPKSFKQ